MNPEAPTCPLCGWRRDVKIPQPSEPTFEVTCPRCGKFAITADAMGSLSGLPTGKKAPLMAFLRERTIQGMDPITITMMNYADLPEGLFAKTVPEKADRLLLNLSRLAPDPGNHFPLDFQRDYPLGHCSWSGTLVYLKDILIKAGYLEADGPQGRMTRLTLSGWMRVGELQTGAIDSTSAFVAMSFRPEWDAAWKDGIRPAIEEDCGYQALRVDAVEHTQDINDRIIGEIRRSKFMVADFSANPGGVYLEAGFEMGLGRSVIWTCQDDEEKKKALHFDISHYNFIFWKDHEDLRKRLRDRILALFGEGPRHERGR